MKVLMTKHKKVRGIRKSENQKVICIQLWNVNFDKASTSYFKSSVLDHTMANDISEFSRNFKRSVFTKAIAGINGWPKRQFEII